MKSNNLKQRKMNTTKFERSNLFYLVSAIYTLFGLSLVLSPISTASFLLSEPQFSKLDFKTLADIEKYLIILLG
jgi:hypothetical protein